MAHSQEKPIKYSVFKQSLVAIVFIISIFILLLYPNSCMAVEQGWMEAQCARGKESLEKQDYANAAHFFRKAAEEGFAEAQFNLGMLYQDGLGVTQDKFEAVRWFHKAAEQGYARAQFDLGVLFYAGEGVAQNYGEAVRWFRKASEQGDAKAQYCLFLAYSRGHGVQKDSNLALNWLQKAFQQGQPDAIKMTAEMEEKKEQKQRRLAEEKEQMRLAEERSQFIREAQKKPPKKNKGFLEKLDNLFSDELETVIQTKPSSQKVVFIFEYYRCLNFNESFNSSCQIACLGEYGGTGDIDMYLDDWNIVAAIPESHRVSTTADTIGGRGVVDVQCECSGTRYILYDK